MRKRTESRPLAAEPVSSFLAVRSAGIMNVKSDAWDEMLYSMAPIYDTQ